MSVDFKLDKNNIDFFFKELAKEYRKVSKIPIEIVIVGGAAIFINYTFRAMSLDIDCLLSPDSKVFKEMVVKIADKYSIPYGWLNDDFTKTRSYSPKLRIYSEYYKTFSNIVEVRYIKGKYLIATKIMSGRKYKNDLSDIVGILYDESKRNNHITIDDIKIALKELYGDILNNAVDQKLLSDIKEIISRNDYEGVYHELQNREMTIRKSLIEFEKDNSKVLTEDNLDKIIKIIESRKQ